MHSGEVSSNELKQLDKGVTNNNQMNWEGLAMSAQRCYSIRDVALAPLSAQALPHHLKPLSAPSYCTSTQGSASTSVGVKRLC